MEIEIISKCLHPNVLRYYTSFTVDKDLWIVQPLVKCGNLRSVLDRVASKGVLDEEVALTIIK